jgi:transcriptional regulator with XRE-family HTH domain
MSQFSNQLQASIEANGFTQTEICDQVGISQGQMSRYVNGENRPEPEIFEKLCGVFAKEHRVAVLLAYLDDDIPPSLKNLVAVEAKTAAARVEEDSPVYRSRMPKKLRDAYDHLGAAALEDASIAQVIIGTSNLTK